MYHSEAVSAHTYSCKNPKQSDKRDSAAKIPDIQVYIVPADKAINYKRNNNYTDIKEKILKFSKQVQKYGKTDDICGNIP